MSVQVELFDVLVSLHNAIAEPDGYNYFVYFKSSDDAKNFVEEMQRNCYSRSLNILYINENSDHCKIFIDAAEINIDDNIPF